jgi:hypothetical protein
MSLHVVAMRDVIGDHSLVDRPFRSRDRFEISARASNAVVGISMSHPATSLPSADVQCAS